MTQKMAEQGERRELRIGPTHLWAQRQAFKKKVPGSPALKPNF